MVAKEAGLLPRAAAAEHTLGVKEVLDLPADVIEDLRHITDFSFVQQGDLAEIIEACARHGIRAIDPWRDQVATIGLDRAVRAVRDAGLELSGYCRGGMFTSDAAHRIEARDDNRRAVDEAKALGAPCVVLVASTTAPAGPRT